MWKSLICGGTDGGLLSQVQDEEDDQWSEAGDAQERQAGDPGYLSRMRHEGVPNREGVLGSRRLTCCKVALAPAL